MNNGILKSGKRRGSHGPGQLKDAQMPILCSTPQGRSHYYGQICDGEVGKRIRVVCVLGEKWNWRRNGAVQIRTFMRSLSSHIDIRGGGKLIWKAFVAPIWGHDDVGAHASTQSYAWVHGLTEAGVCVIVWGLHYPQRACRCLWSGLLPEALLLFEHHTELIPSLADMLY